MYIIIYCKEIIKEREIFVGGTILVILTLRFGDNLFSSYKQELSLAIFCIAIPIAGFKSWNKYYKKAKSNLSEIEINVLNSLKYGEDTIITVNYDNKETLNAIKYLAEKSLITKYNNVHRHQKNNQTKVHTYKLALTPEGKDYKEKKNI